MGKHIVGKVADFPPGERKIVEAEGRSIGVFNVHGSYYAIRNSCPHQGAPLCLGSIKGTMVASEPHAYEYAMEGKILVCPWHCWEFDITTGRSVFNPHKMRVKTYSVTVEPDEEPSLETYEITVEKGLVVLHV